MYGGYNDFYQYPDMGMSDPPQMQQQPVNSSRRKLIISGVEGKICTPWTADRFGPVASGITKPRRVAEAARTPEACNACKRIKKKCDDLRPCSRCVRLGRGNQCSSWSKDDAVVVRKSISVNSLECDPDRAFPKVTANHDLVCEAIMKVWSFGLRIDSVVQIFNTIPPEVFPVMKKFFERPHPAKTKAIENGDQPLVEETSLEQSDLDDDGDLATDAEKWENDETYGYLQLAFDPGATKLWRNVGMNARYAEIHGYSKEELLARFARHEAELQRTERDALFFFLFTFRSILNGSGPSEIYSRIITGSGDSLRASLVWVLMGNVLNRRGQLKKLTVLIKVITAEEYDDAVRRMPESCVLHVMGDRRTGQQLLEDIQVDVYRPVAALGRDEEDQELINRIAML